MNGANSSSQWLAREIFPWPVALWMVMAGAESPTADFGVILLQSHERAKLRACIESILGAVKRGAPPPGTSVRMAFVGWLTYTVIFLLLWRSLS